MAMLNRITKVAIIGVSDFESSISFTSLQRLTNHQAGGNSGSFITSALLKTGKHTVTALTRADSQNKLPEGVIIKTVDYMKPETFVEALKGQDALVITLSSTTTKETEMQIINAAGEAGVGWVLPNEWCPDSENEALVNDVTLFKSRGKKAHCIYTL